MSNQRQETRLNRSETVFIEVHSAYPPTGDNCKLVICDTLDLSANGIRAVIDQSLKSGSIYQLCVELHETSERLFLAGQIKWCSEPDECGDCQVGIEIFESDDTDIEAWKAYIADELSTSS